MEITHLGKASALPASPEEAALDYVPNPRPGALYLVRFAAPEFTSLCPVTGQPDFAHLVIDYAPGETIVAFAEDVGADEIVMGTRGLGGLAGLLLGSVATEVISLAKVPVTLVK